MISTGKKARRQYGTRFAAKKAKGGKGKTFFSQTSERVIDPEQIHRNAIATARRMGFPAPVDIVHRHDSFEDQLARDF